MCSSLFSVSKWYPTFIKFFTYRTVLETTHATREEETAKLNSELQALQKAKDTELSSLQEELKSLRLSNGAQGKEATQEKAEKNDKKNKDKNRDDKSVESVVDEQKLNRQKLLGTSADARKRNL